MRSIATIFCLSLIATAAASQTTVPAPGGQQPAATAAPSTESGPTADQLLQRGRDDYRAARYTEAAQELRAAAAAFLSPEEKQRYIDTGKLATLPQVEESLVYLALAYSKLGKEPEARDAVMRLANAERISPTFATLPLDPETADFPLVVARVAPNLTLPQNVQLARGGVAATPATTAAQAAVPQVVPPQPTAAPTVTAGAQPIPAAPQPAATTPAATVAQAAPAPAAAIDRAAMLKQMDEQVAAARAEIDREAAAKIAEAQRQADARVAAEKAAADKAAQQKIDAERAAAEQAAAERIAADRAAIQRDADAKIAAERAAADKAAQQQAAAQSAAAAAEQKIADEKAAADKAAAERQAQARIAAAQAESEQQRTWLTSIRQAESLAESGNLDEANRMYVAVANAPNAPREIIAAAATGLYRTSDFRDAAAAFKRLAGFARGEEDLRYYNAVSLFEIGRFDEAKLELACALPFIQVTDDVLRYRSKIEQMPAQQAMK